MLDSKERAALRSKANGLDTIVHVGKGGVIDTLVTQAYGALRTRELIKCRVLESSMLTAREAAEELASRTNSEIVQVIGSIFVLYRKSDEKKAVKAKKVSPIRAGKQAREAKRKREQEAIKQRFLPYKPKSTPTDSARKPSSAGRPSSAGKTSYAGKPSSAVKTSYAGKPSSAGKTSYTGKPSSTGKPSNAGRPSSTGRPSNAGKPSSAGKTSNAGKKEYR